MKTVYLILYLWHANSAREQLSVGASAAVARALNGGPVLKIEQMPNLAACETVGSAVKALVDASQPARNPGPENLSQPAQFRCIEVSK